MKVYQKQPLQCSSYAKRVNIPLRAGAEEGGYLIHFREGEGFLGGGIGSEEVDIGTEAQISAFFRAGQAAAAYAPTGELYAGADMGDTGISFTDIPACLPLPDGDGMLLSDGTACARVSAAGAQSLPLPFRTAVFAYGRLWRTADGVRLYFGAPDDYEEQAEERGKAGYIDCPDAKGKILHLFFVKNEVYVLREYGLQKLTAHGDEEEFAFEDVLSCARVCGGSAAATQSALFWLAEDGFHVFGDAKVNGYSEFFAPHTDFAATRAAACGNKYILRGKYTLPDGTEEEGVGVFDVQGRGYLFPRKLEGLVCVGNKVYFTHGGKAYAVTERGYFLGEMVSRIWQSPPVEPFGCRALLAEVRVRSAGPFVLYIESEESNRVLVFSGGLQKKRVLLAGTAFSFRVQAEECELYSLSAVFHRGEDDV